jgi:hypothetical protein
VGVSSVALEPAKLAGCGRAIRSVGFDWAMTGLCAWFIGGVVTDNWAHGHQQLIGRLETFFTPWHGILYSGWLAVTIFLVGAFVRNVSRRCPWRRALPAGYGLSLLGVAVFTWGGLADMIWHSTYGIESGLDATYSPPHLILGLGLVLTMSGPLRAAWSDGLASGWLARLPMVISLTFTLSIVGFFTLFTEPLVNPWAGESRRLSLAELGRSLGIASIVLHTGVLMGLVLLAVLRRPLPPGALTLVFTLNGLMMVAGSWPEHYRMVPVASVALAGVAADVLLSWLKPSATRPGPLRVFAFAVPAMLYLLHFLTLKLTDGIWWSVHLWTGSICVAGIVGWMISYVFVPPAYRRT